MIEYRIEIPSKLSVVKILWKKFLKDDPMWHFTLEGTYIEIRVSKENPSLETFLKKRKWKYTKFDYKDNIPITRKYQKQFEYIFHGYSELAMLVPKEKNTDWEISFSETRRVLERCVHLACNILGYSLGGESRTLTYLALIRAHMAGSMNYSLETFYQFNKRTRSKSHDKK